MELILEHDSHPLNLILKESGGVCIAEADHHYPTACNFKDALDGNVKYLETSGGGHCSR